MKLKELLNSNMNSWLSYGLKKNPLFTATIYFADRSDNLLEEYYQLKADYTDDENYLLKWHNREVIYWYATGRNDLTIEIEGHY